MSATISLVGSLLEAVTELGRDPSALRAQLREVKRESAPGASLRPLHSWLEEQAFELTGDAALGLHLGERQSDHGFGIIGQLANASRSLRDCIAVALTYYPLILDGQSPALRTERGRALMIYPGSFGTPRSLRLWTEFGMARFAQFGRRFVGAGAAVETWFAYPRPGYAEEYTRIFGDGVRFDMPHNAFVFAEPLLEVMQPNWDPFLHELLKSQADRALERLSAPRVSQRVGAVLASLRLGERPEMSMASTVLGMSERALRRKLASEGVSFRELVDDVQRERALRLGKDPTRSAESVSNVLGFSEVSAYHRAFKRWTGLTPLQYRTAHQEAATTGEPAAAIGATPSA
jgi:AraC-like DNA-binding protein